MAKRKNPADATLRNVRAAKTRVIKIALDVKQIKQAIPTLRQLVHFNQRLNAIEKKVYSHTQALRTLYESTNLTQLRPQKGKKR